MSRVSGSGGREGLSVQRAMREGVAGMTQLDNIDVELAEKGKRCMRRRFDMETIEEWEAPGFVEVDLEEIELEELALSLGEHRNHIRDEARASSEAGFDERACGLLFAIHQTNKLIQRVRASRETGGSLMLSQFDFVNLLGVNSYKRIIEDHADWMNRLMEENPSLVEESDLLQFFSEDFNDLEEAHSSMARKLVNVED